MLLNTIVCGALRFGGHAQSEDQMGVGLMPHSLSILLQLQFQLYLLCPFSSSWCISCLGILLFLCLRCKRKKLYSNLFQGLLTKGWLFMDQFVGTSVLERYWSVAPSSGIREKETQAKMSYVVSPNFFSWWAWNSILFAFVYVLSIVDCVVLL